MKRDIDAMNILAMTADAEARATAQLVEMMAVSIAVKLGVSELELSQADVNAAMSEHKYSAGYDEHGTMTLRITKIDAEVTSGVDNRHD